MRAGVEGLLKPPHGDLDIAEVELRREVHLASRAKIPWALSSQWAMSLQTAARSVKYLPRALTGPIRRAMGTFPAVLVTGARQSGKTTLLRHEFGRTHRYLSLERPDVRARASSDPVAFLEDHPPPIFLDEIQYAPDLPHFVKARIDDDRSPERWLLAGSQSLPVIRGIRQTLAGRVAVLTLDSLATFEVRGWRPPASIDAVLREVFNGAPEGRPKRRKATAGPDLSRWLSLAGKNAHGVLACRLDAPVGLSPGIRAVPWHLAWS